jgi:glycosyltransferase involved in cell wall biosynthesis
VLFLNWRDTGHPEGGGSEVYAEHVCDGLAQRGHEVTLLTARYPGSEEEEVRPSGVRVVRLGGRLGVYPRAAWAVRTGRVPRPDVVVETQNGVPYLAAVWAGRAAHLVLVHHVHREQWPVVFGPVVARLGWFIESRVAPLVNRRRPYVAVSEVTREELAALGVRRDRVSVVHNGALPPPPHDVRRSEEPQLLVLGRLVPHKRVEVALEVMSRLRAEFPTARLVVAGRGWWREQVRAEVERLGLEDVVDVVGYVSTAERHRLLASSWVSLVPSVKEGWGLVVVEAGMHATPTIAFRGTGGIIESIVDGETGYLAAEDDVDDFTELTRRLLLDAAERGRLGKGAEEYASAFTWETTVDRFEAAIAGALERRTGRTR